MVAVNLLGWPRDVLPFELAAEVLRGGLDGGREAGCHVAGGHSVDDPEPKYGMAVTGVADPDRLCATTPAGPGLPLTLTKPLGIGVLNSRHKATGEVFAAGGRDDDDAQPGRRPGRRSPPAITAATDVTGFGLLGHLLQAGPGQRRHRGRGRAAVPYLDGARAALAAGFVSGGTRRNLDWVRPHADRRRGRRGRAAAARRRADLRRPAASPARCPATR